MKLGDLIITVILITDTFLILSAIIFQGIENKKYDKDCKSFTSTFEQLTHKDCVSYLLQFPNMTGQEMIDYHDSKTDRLLEERVYTPEVLTKDKSKRTPVTYKLTDVDSSCHIFIKTIKDIEYETYKIIKVITIGNYRPTSSASRSL